MISMSYSFDKDSNYFVHGKMLIFDGHFFLHTDQADPVKLISLARVLEALAESKMNVQTPQPIEEAKPEQASDASRVHGLPQDSDAPIQSYSNVGSGGLDAKWSDYAELAKSGTVGIDISRNSVKFENYDNKGSEVLKDDDIPF